VKDHGKCIVVTEEQQYNSFAESLAARISRACFQYLECPVEVLGSLNVPAIPMNTLLEKAVLPNEEKVGQLLASLLNF
jgi:2-oxoisovalerate dehydrogenase E1 component